MSSLLPNNATSFERALDQTAARISDVPVKIAETWHAQSCQVNLLPWLAWALSVDQWNDNWSEAVKRDVIENALIVHRRKGTEAAVKSVVKSVFTDGEIIKSAEFNGAPHTFKVVTYGLVNSDTDYATLTKLVNNNKPARSRLVAIVVQKSAVASLRFAAAIHTGTHITITA